MLKIILTILLITHTLSLACGNLYDEDKHSTKKRKAQQEKRRIKREKGYAAQRLPGFIKNFSYKDNLKKWQLLKETLNLDTNLFNDYKIKNNYAVSLMHLGGADSAIVLLIEIEHDHPGLYETAANLGTAYEMNGQNDSALKWIKEDIKRNRRAHFGTEWIHTKILEAKINLEKDPDYLKTHNITDFVFGNKGKPLSQATGMNPSENMNEIALNYQIKERLTFVNKPNPVMGELLLELGSLYLLNQNYIYSFEILKESIKFKPYKITIANKRKRYAEKMDRVK